MKLLFVTVAVIAVTSAAALAQVQKSKAPVYRYCLLERMGGGFMGGEMMTCRFNTLAQCMASKGAISDTCIINPQLTFPPR